MEVIIQAGLICLLSIGISLFFNAEYKKIRCFRDYRDLRPYVLPSAIAFGGLSALIILFYLGSPFLAPETLIGLLGGYLAIAVAIPLIGTLTAILCRFRGNTLRREVDKPGSRYLETSLNLATAAFSIIVLWYSLEREAFIYKPWYQLIPLESTLDKVCSGLLIAYAILESIFLVKFVLARYPNLGGESNESYK